MFFYLNVFIEHKKKFLKILFTRRSPVTATKIEPADGCDGCASIV